MTKILIGGAWPYANSSRHIGHLASSMLPADIYARYRRIIGDDVIFLSGSDAHGTPIILKSLKRGVDPRELVDYYHEEYIDNFIKLGISYNLFSRTDSSHHRVFTQLLYENLKRNGHIDLRSSCVATDGENSLPDRYVEGDCTYCKYQFARGDQCDSCGRLMDKETILNPHSILNQKSVTFEEQDNVFLRLENFKNQLHSWFRNSTFNRSFISNSLRESLGSLRARSISRKISWGIDVDDERVPEQKFYVWFDAVIGYLSASSLYSELSGVTWESWWSDNGSERYFFFGKDNLIFHSVFLQSILLGGGGNGIPNYLSLPTELVASEFFVQREGDEEKTAKLSASRGVENNNMLNYLTEKYHPDYVRYYVTLDGPENKDVIFDEELLKRRVNNELIAKWGNLWHRVTFMLSKKYAGLVSKRINRCEFLYDMFYRLEKIVDTQIKSFAFARALKQIMLFVDELNVYLSVAKPWSSDDDSARETLCNVFDLALLCNRMLYPFIPFSSSRVVEHIFGLQPKNIGKRKAFDDGFNIFYMSSVNDSMSFQDRYPQKAIEPLMLYEKIK
jgi:methionyl-tRNA synthetase